ncbi:MAG: putative membrane protein (GlpM family) [Ilumatobacter sp.]|jgi:uncharacterized membrane protein (GlpM family)
MSNPKDRVPLAVGLDTFLVVAFVAIGRRNHDQDPGVLGLLSTAAPFLIGLVAAWLVVKAWKQPTRLRTGLMIWPITVAVGMIARQIIGGGTALSFVIVAILFVGATLVGWRAVFEAIASRRPDATTPTA